MQFRFTLLLALISVTAFANTNPSSVSVVPAAENVYNVYFKSAETEKVKISILDKYNQVVFTERISKGSFKRPYNFSNMAYGQYQLIVESASGVSKNTIEHVSTKIKSVIKVSAISKEEGKFAVRITNTGTQLATIRIYDNIRGLIFDKQVDVNGSFGQIYNVSKARSSEDSIIMFEVSSNGKVETALF
jgi:hypothetical protein